MGVGSEGDGSDVEVQNGVGVRNIDEVVSDTFLVGSTDFVLGEFSSNLGSTQDVVDVELESGSTVGPVTEGDNSEEDSDTRVREERTVGLFDSSVETTEDGDTGAGREGIGKSVTGFISPALSISESGLVEFVGNLVASGRRTTKRDDSEVSETEGFVISGFIEDTSDGEVDGGTSVGDEEINLDNSFGPASNTTDEVWGITVVPVRSVESVDLTVSNNLDIIVSVGRVNQPEIEREEDGVVTR